MITQAANADRNWLERAIDLSTCCAPSATAFSVGAIVVDIDGNELSTGYSRETDPHIHAEASALGKLPRGDLRLSGATLYSSLEPCALRKSGRPPCTDLIIAAAIKRVVVAWREPPIFVATDCLSTRTLIAAGVSVVVLSDLEEKAREVNAHLFGGR